MPGVFLVNNNYTIVLSKEAVKLSPQLSKLNNDQLLYIILAYDYTDGPYRLHPIEDRKRLAKRRIWKDKDFVPEDYKNMKEAIHEYKGLIYDYEREYRDVLVTKLQQLNNKFALEEDPRTMQYLMKSIELVESKLNEVETKIDIKEQDLKLKGNKTISLIEKFQRNKDKYLERMMMIMKEKNTLVNER